MDAKMAFRRPQNSCIIDSIHEEIQDALCMYVVYYVYGIHKDFTNYDHLSAPLSSKSPQMVDSKAYNSIIISYTSAVSSLNYTFSTPNGTTNQPFNT